MPKPYEICDEDGNQIPGPDMKTDVGQLVWFLEYCRARGFQVGPTVQVGATIAQVRDLRQIEGKPQEPDEKNIWEAHGHIEK